MPWIEFPTAITVAVDILAWFVIHMLVAWILTRQQAHPSSFQGFITSHFRFETATAYERWLLIKPWKSRLPDAAPWFNDGFPKRSLASKDPNYLARFIVETRRAELSHWICVMFSPLFFIWNPLWVGCLMVVVGLGLNLPCVLVQRYNRLRLLSVVHRHTFRKHGQP